MWVLYGGPHGANTSNHHQYFTEASIGRGASSGTDDGFGFSVDHRRLQRRRLRRSGDRCGGQDNRRPVSFRRRRRALRRRRRGSSPRTPSSSPRRRAGCRRRRRRTSYFGYSVAAGDFNHDGRADLAIGAYGRRSMASRTPARCTSCSAPSHGLSHASPLLPKKFDQTTPGLHGGAKSIDGFGNTLAAADFDGDHYADLAIGAPGKTIAGQSICGRWSTSSAAARAVSPAPAARRGPKTPRGSPTRSEYNDHVRATLGTIDINGDGRSELVIGAPSESQGATASVGAATVLYGSSHGLTTDGVLFYSVEQHDRRPVAGHERLVRIELLRLSTSTVTAVPTSQSAWKGAASVAPGRSGRSGGAAQRRWSTVADRRFHARPQHERHDRAGRSRPGVRRARAGRRLERQRQRRPRGVTAVPGREWPLPCRRNAGVLQRRLGLATNDQLFTANSLGGTPYTNADLGGYDFSRVRYSSSVG